MDMTDERLTKILDRFGHTGHVRDLVTALREERALAKGVAERMAYTVYMRNRQLLDVLQEQIKKVWPDEPAIPPADSAAPSLPPAEAEAEDG